jgi:Phage integrase, N-terminal SAM-like domain
MASIKKREDGKYRARYRDLDGREHARHFTHRRDAELWLAEQVRAVGRGQHVDPRAGRQLFADYVEEWFARQVHRPATSEALRRQLDRHVLPHLGSRPIGALRRSDLQAFVKGRSDELAPRRSRSSRRGLRRSCERRSTTACSSCRRGARSSYRRWSDRPSCRLP